MEEKHLIFYVIGNSLEFPITQKAHFFIWIIRFGCQKVCFITFIGKLHKRNMESFSLCNGDKTHESWKPLLNTIHVFRGLSECLHNETCNISFVQSDIINLNADLLTPESLSEKSTLQQIFAAKDQTTAVKYKNIRRTGDIFPSSNSAG